MNRAHRLVTFALAAALIAPATAGAQSTEHTLSVVGRGQVELRPDRGSFSVGVVRRSRSANVARSQTNARVAAIVAGLRALGIARADISTGEISIVRVGHRTRKHGPLRIRFRASVSLQVAVAGVELLGRAIDVASRRGATAIFGPDLSFSPARRAVGRSGAETAALRDARTRAEAAAAVENQRIVGVQSIDLDPGEAVLTEFASDTAAAGGGSAGAPTRVFAGRRRFTSDARVTYVIEPVG